MDNLIRDIFVKCDLSFNSIDNLNGVSIPRDLLINDEKYEQLKDDILGLRKYLCSSSFTSLHKNAEKKQQWPLLNLVRQLLKAQNYALSPYKKSNGYTKDGKKKFIRYFRITKIE